MTVVGIMHGGSPQTSQGDIDSLTAKLRADCKNPPEIGAPHWGSVEGDLSKIAQRLIEAKVDVLIAAGGSRSAKAAIDARGNASTPIIVFTSVAPHILKNLPANVTGVCAHTSDTDDKRLAWLVEMLKKPLKGKRIGVLRSSNRGDHQDQKDKIDGGMKHNDCTPHHRDINSNLTIKDAFDYFRGDIHALLVAADPFFYNHREEVVKNTKHDKYPAVFQWRQFVELGGLMSYGPSLKTLYEKAGAMAAEIVNTGKVPPVYEAQEPSDFELVVNGTTAKDLQLWPLPKSVADRAEVIK